MKVSVIIPTFNEEKAISDCLESLRKQTLDSSEIIVVDDGSSDNTIGSVEDGVKILKQNHKGPGAARNLGAKEAKGEILVFVDADMTFDNDFVSKLIIPIEAGKTIGTFSKEEYLANKGNVWAACWNVNRGLPKDRMHPDSYPDTQKVFRAILKKEFDKVGGFDERAGYTDDWTLAEKLGVEAVLAPGAVFYHKNPDNLKDVFIQAKWMGKRKYKFGILGYLIALIRSSLPVSILIGLVQFNIYFLIFKIVYDFGVFIGIIEYLGGNVSK
jgi:glycosyltransferase involved in cell wall biosynthesis